MRNNFEQVLDNECPMKNAEEEGFEPSKRFHVYTLSKRAPSAARTLLRKVTSVDQS